MQFGPNEKVITMIKASRKKFIIEYSCGFFLLGITGLLLLDGISLPGAVLYFIVGVALFSMAAAELSRVLTRYVITDTKLIIVHGIIQQMKKNIYFQPLGFVPDLNVKQGRVQRLLNYGTVFLRGNNENAFEIRDINQPHKILRMIEELVETNKRKMQ